MQFSQANFDQTRRIYSIPDGELTVRDGKKIAKPRPTPESVNSVALATLLYTGMVLPPDTIFNDFHAIGMGGTLTAENGNVSYHETEDLFEQESTSDAPFDPIHVLAEAMENSGVDFAKCKLLLSEGKDSTGIAIALAELGAKVDCVTFANSDTNVELIEDIARRLGHRLKVIRYQDHSIPQKNLELLTHVFEPTVDQAFLSYLLLPTEVFHDSIVIDGMGNDLFMGHLPSGQQLRATRACDVTSWLTPRWLRDMLKGKLFRNSDYCGIPMRSFTECQGLYNGFDLQQIRKLVGKPRTLDPIDSRWKRLGFERARALSRGRYLDTYSFCGKSIALAEMAGAKIYFPWAEESVAQQFGRIRPETKYQWPTVNKQPLRAAINQRFDYRQPKVGFRAPVKEILASNRTLLESAVKDSALIPDPLKREVFSPSPYENRLVACALIALWERASQ